MRTFFIIAGIFTICAFAIGILSWIGLTPRRIWKLILEIRRKMRLSRKTRPVHLQGLIPIVKSNYENKIESIKIAELLDDKSSSFFGHYSTYGYHFNYDINYKKVSQDSLIDNLISQIVDDVVSKGKANDVTALVYLNNELNEHFAFNFGKRSPGTGGFPRAFPLVFAQDMNIKFPTDSNLGVGEKVIVLESLLISPIPFEKLLVWLNNRDVNISAAVILWDGGLKFFNAANHNLTHIEIFRAVSLDLMAVHEANCDCHKQGFDPEIIPDVKHSEYGNNI